jgi:proline racemase
MFMLQIHQRRKFWGISSLLEMGGFAYVMAISSLVLTDRDPFPTGFNLEEEEVAE